MAEKITVVVVDDHSLFRAGVIQSLIHDDTIEILGEGSLASEAVQLVNAPGIAILTSMGRSRCSRAKPNMVRHTPRRRIHAVDPIRDGCPHAGLKVV